MSKARFPLEVVAPLLVIGLIVAVLGGAQMTYLQRHRPFIEHSKAEERVFASLKPNAFVTLNFGAEDAMCLRFLGYERVNDTDLRVSVNAPNLGIANFFTSGDSQEFVAPGCTQQLQQTYYAAVEVDRQYAETEKRLKRYAAFFAHLRSGDRFTVNYDGSEDFCQTFVSVKRNDPNTDYIDVTSKLAGSEPEEDMYTGAEQDVHAGCSSKQPT